MYVHAFVLGTKDKWSSVPCNCFQKNSVYFQSVHVIKKKLKGIKKKKTTKEWREQGVEERVKYSLIITFLGKLGLYKISNVAH